MFRSTVLGVGARPPLTSVAVCRHLVASRVFITLNFLALRCTPTALVPCRHPPPLSSRRVIPHPRLSRLRRRSEGTAASAYPSPSRRWRGKIPSIFVILRSDDDASRRPPPPSSRVSNICSRSASATTTPPPPSPPPHVERPSMQRTPPQHFC